LYLPAVKISAVVRQGEADASQAAEWLTREPGLTTGRPWAHRGQFSG
jgi:hypothetical protein